MVKRSPIPIYFALCALLLVSILFAATAGSVSIPLAQVVEVVWQWAAGIETDLGFQEKILLTLRFPRLFMAIFVGASLAIAGLVYQNTLRNPLAEPYILGVSSGAAFFAVVSRAFFPSSYLLSVGASFLGGLFVIFLIIFISQLKRSHDEVFILLAGVMINFLMGALMMAAIFLGDSTQQGELLYLWMGSLSGLWTWQILLVAAVLLICTVLIYTHARALDALAVGVEWTHDLGINANRARLTLLVVASLLVATTVPLVGMIGFVGLIAPHLARQFLPIRCSLLLPATALIGSIVTLLADATARNITFMQTEMPIGVVSALIGSPLFLWILIRLRRPGHSGSHQGAL